MRSEPQEEPAPLAATIIIATYNRVAHLEECLSALPWEHLESRGVEVIVVDDGSPDTTAALVRTQFPRAILLENGRNRGLAFSRNAGAHAARGGMLLYLDDDAVVQEGWLDAMLACDDGETVLGGRILDYEGDREQGGPAYSTFLGKRLPCKAEDATVGTGANLGVPRRCVLELGGFDEDLPYYFEDSDICIRAHQAGYRFRYVAEGVVRHKGTEVKKGAAIRMQEQNSTYAMLKAYRGQWGKWLLFFLLNGLWLVLRLVRWGIRRRFADCRLLLLGWLAAYRKYFAA